MGWEDGADRRTGRPPSNGRVQRRGPRPLADLMGGIVDPVLRRKSGMSVDLIGAWASLVGPALAGRSRPIEIRWPRRRGEDDPFEPATLIVGCEAGAGLRLQHEADELVARINAFFGFAAIARLKVVQSYAMPATPSRKPRSRPLSEADRERVEHVGENVEDERLRAALKGFARSMLERAER